MSLAGLVLACVLFVPAPVTADPAFRAAILASAAVGGADIATTAQAAERGGFYEINPLFRPLYGRPLLLGLANGALTAAILLAIAKLHQKHPRIAHALAWGSTAARGYVVLRNVRTLKAGR